VLELFRALMSAMLLLPCVACGWAVLSPSALPHTAPRSPQPVAVISSPFPSPGLPSPHQQLQSATGHPLSEAYQSSPWPYRVMIFIDGSWLYYSIYGRRPECPLTRQYGEGWTVSHTVAFDRLPHLISQHLHKQLLKQHGSQRFVEVARTIVFTSARADTHKLSRRMQMFQQMAQSNFEVHMRTTTGIQEKCIDIQLAVDMMHYANVPGAYDCAVLLSGDKDFMPAMSRIRQSGKAVALCSMRNCCSQDMLSPSAHVRDFEPIWLDDYLDYLVLPTANLAPGVPASTRAELLRVVTDYLREQGGSASSRNIGRYLQAHRMSSGEDGLSQLKQKHNGLRAYFSGLPGHFRHDRRPTVRAWLTRIPGGSRLPCECRGGAGGGEAHRREDRPQ